MCGITAPAYATVQCIQFLALLRATAFGFFATSFVVLITTQLLLEKALLSIIITTCPPPGFGPADAQAVDGLTTGSWVVAAAEPAAWLPGDATCANVTYRPAVQGNDALELGVVYVDAATGLTQAGMYALRGAGTDLELFTATIPLVSLGPHWVVARGVGVVPLRGGTTATSDFVVVVGGPPTAGSASAAGCRPPGLGPDGTCDIVEDDEPSQADFTSGLFETPYPGGTVGAAIGVSVLGGLTGQTSEVPIPCGEGIFVLVRGGPAAPVAAAEGVDTARALGLDVAAVAPVPCG